MNSNTLRSFRGLARLTMAALALFALFCGLAIAQETTGSIQGQVTDPSGAAVVGAKVEISGGVLPRAIELTTDATGSYVLPQIPVGSYAVTVTASGFTTVKKTDTPVVIGKSSRVDFKLEVGKVTESVVVAADAVMVDTTSSSSAINVDKSFFDLMPKGRSFYDLVNLAPGARAEGKTGGIQVDGASGSENTFYLDGMEVTNIQTGVLDTRNRVPVEMVQQVQVKNGVMDAQYGGAMGGVINAVVRSGSNEFHGNAGFYFNNDAMRARPRPELRLKPTNENAAEYFLSPMDIFKTWNPVINVAGPVLPNKLFFFAGFMPQWTNNTRTVKFNSGQTGTYDRKDFQHYSVAKLDYLPFTKLRTNLSWIWNPTYTRGRLPAAGGTEQYDYPYAGSGNYTAGNIISGQVDYLASSKLIVSVRGGYSYSNFTNNYALPSFTSIYYSGASTTLPPPELRGPNGYIQNPTAFTKYDIYKRTNLNADATYMANWFGQHNLKGGWQTNRLSNSVTKSDWANGYYRYYWGNSWTCITSQCSGAQKGTYGFYRYRVIGTYGDAESNNNALFFQDTWRVNKRLTLNLGIRTEREYLPSFSFGGSTALPPIEFSWSQKFSPRLGFALDPTGDGKQRIYASWGNFYDIMKYEMPRGSFGGDVWKEYYYSFDDPNLVRTNNAPPADPTKLPGKLFEVVNWRIPSNDPAAGLIDPNLKPMKQRMFDLGYEYSLSPTLLASLRYTNRRLIQTIEDIGYIGDEGETYLIANPGMGIVGDQKNWDKWMGKGIPATPKARRDYDAIEFRLDKRFAKNYQYAASYTWSRSYGNYSGLASSDEDGRTSPNVNRYFDLPWLGYTEKGRLAEGLLATDRPHTLKFFGSYSLKSPVGTTTLAPNISVYSGTPLTTEIPVISSTPAFPYGRGDMGRTPVFYNFDFNVQQDYFPFKSHESMKLRFELYISNLLNSSIVNNRFKTILHETDGHLGFPQYAGYADFFKGFNTVNQIKAEDMRIDPRYGMASGFQSPRSLRLQLTFFF